MVAPWSLQVGSPPNSMIALLGNVIIGGVAFELVVLMQGV